MKTTFNLCQIPEVKANFKDYFNVQFDHYHDKFMSVLTQRVQLDVLKFDDYLHAKHGQYENEGLSMKTAIVKYYGKSAKDLIESLI